MARPGEESVRAETGKQIVWPTATHGGMVDLCAHHKRLNEGYARVENQIAAQTGLEQSDPESMGPVHGTCAECARNAMPGPLNDKLKQELPTGYQRKLDQSDRTPRKPYTPGVTRTKGFEPLRQSENAAQSYFHGTTETLRPGDQLLPGGSRGVTRYEHMQPEVYVSHRPHVAGDYARMTSEDHGGDPHVYEVRPHTTPTFEDQDEWTTPKATVIRELEPHEWDRWHKGAQRHTAKATTYYHGTANEPPENENGYHVIPSGAHLHEDPKLAWHAAIKHWNDDESTEFPRVYRAHLSDDEIKQHDRRPGGLHLKAPVEASEIDHDPEHHPEIKLEGEEGPTLYHGTSHFHDPDDEDLEAHTPHEDVVPGGTATHGHLTRSAGHAYATPSLKHAWHYANDRALNIGGTPHVYRVTPKNPADVEKDPMEDAAGNSRGNYEHDKRSPTGFDVLDEVPPTRRQHAQHKDEHAQEYGLGEYADEDEGTEHWGSRHEPFEHGDNATCAMCDNDWPTAKDMKLKCYIKHDGDCSTGVPPRKVAMPSQRHAEPEGFSHTIERFPADKPEFPTHNLIGALNGQPVGAINFSRSDDGKAIHVHKLHVDDEAQHKGVASAMMDRLVSEHPDAWINHGARTSEGLKWWAQYKDPAPECNTQTHQPSEGWGKYFHPRAVSRDMADNYIGDHEHNPLMSMEYKGYEEPEQDRDGSSKWTRGEHWQGYKRTKEHTAMNRKIAHDSGDSQRIFHCPFCGAGQVIGRSDGTTECEFCQAHFTVQVQPQFNSFPQTINGMPVQIPGMPGQNDALMGGMPPGGAPGAPGEPGNPDPSQDPDNPFGGGDDAEGDAQDDSGDDGGDGGDDKPDFLKSKSYRTASGALLNEEQYLRHLALIHAPDHGKMAEHLRRSRA